MKKSNFMHSPIHYSTNTMVLKELYSAMHETINSSKELEDDPSFKQINDYMFSIIKEEVILSGVVTLYHAWEKHVVEYFEITTTPKIGLVYHVKNEIIKIATVDDLLDNTLEEINRYRLIVNFRKHGSENSLTQLFEKYPISLRINNDSEYELNINQISYENLSKFLEIFWIKIDEFSQYDFMEK